MKTHFMTFCDEEDAASACGLGTYRDKNFERGTKDWDEVTCRSCLRCRNKLDREMEAHIKRSLEMQELAKSLGF